MEDRKLIFPECPICGNVKTLTPQLEIDGLTVVKCENDELLFFHPNVDTQTHLDYLDENYWVGPAFQRAKEAGDYNFDKYLEILNEGNSEIKGYPDYIEKEHLNAKISWGRRILQWFLRYSNGRELKTVMDVGCATGHMLKGFIEMGGFELAIGVDVSDWSIRQGKKLLSNLIETGQLELYRGEVWEIEYKRKLDCIILWDSIEHIQEVGRALKSIRENSNPGALLIVHTPDAEFAGGSDWYLWSPEQHCHFYTEKTLGMLLDKYGFEKIARKVSPEVDEMLLIYKKK